MLYLICKQVSFYSEGDEISFFKWLKEIEAIKDIKGIGDEIQLAIKNSNIDENSLRELIAIFYRYKIEMSQLKQFLNEGNEYWFKANDCAYWKKGVFGS